MTRGPKKREKPEGRSARVQSLERGLQMLELIAEGHRPLATVAAQARLNLSTAHHLVKTLEGLGYVSQGPDRTYRIASRAFRLAAAAWNDDDLANLAEPIVSDLGRETGETSQLAVFDRREVIVISKCEAAGPGRVFERLGMPRPAYCTALGKVLLAYQPEGVRERYLESVELAPYTPKTIVALGALRTELTVVAARGHAVDDEEFSQGIRCVAAPVFSFSNGVVAALGAFGAVWRLSDERLPAVVSTVRGMAERLSRALAYSAPYPGAATPNGDRRAIPRSAR